MKKRETMDEIEEMGNSEENKFNEPPLITVKSKTKEVNFDNQSEIKFPIVCRAIVINENAHQRLVKQQKHQVKVAKNKHVVKYSIQSSDCAKYYRWHGKILLQKGKLTQDSGFRIQMELNYIQSLSNLEGILRHLENIRLMF